MPPRPKSPAMRYRPATTVPGRKRPSSTLMVVLRWGTLEAPVPRTTVSAELASSGAAQDEQKRLFWAHSREQAGHRTIRLRSILARRGAFSGAFPHKTVRSAKVLATLAWPDYVLAAMGSAFRNLLHAVRSLMGDRGFTVTVVLTIAVCIAANTATFAVVNSVLLRPLPVPDARSVLLMVR